MEIFQIHMEYLYLSESFLIMHAPLRQIGLVTHQPKESINDAMRGVDFDYTFSGERVGKVGQIELTVTSIVTDWEKNIYYRTGRYLGHHEGWKKCIKSHIFNHLIDLGIGIMLVRAMLDDFVVDKSHFKVQP